MNEPLHDTPTLLAALHLYDEAITLTRYHAEGGSTTYPVAPRDVVGALSTLPLSSGWLPPHTLFWHRRQGKECLGLYVPARRWRVPSEGRTYQLPLPPLCLIGWGAQYWLYALKRRPTAAVATLFHVPLPNVNGEGAVCQGAARFPICRPDTIQRALHLILEGSAFNDHLTKDKCRRHPDDVRQLWAELDGQRRFPLGQLLPAPVALNGWVSGRVLP